MSESDRNPGPLTDRWVLLLAQGFGSGLLKPAPGTWGSLVGILWLLILLSASNPVAWAFGTVALLAVAIPVCGRAEVLLGRHDPGSVVLDEIAAVPLIWLGPLFTPGGQLFASPVAPSAVAFAYWPELLTGFLAFRFFDVVKPGPIRRIQHLRGGAGVVADDVLAALAAALITGVVSFLRWRTA